MWPHSITVGLGGKAISLGSDDEELISRLEPWRINDVGEPTDYCLELDPAAPGAGQPRPLPGLYHGSTALLRSRDRARLTAALLRVLASYARPADDGQIRVGLMPIVHSGVALLAPSKTISTVPDRWIVANGFDAIYTVSSLIDADRGLVLLDPPLGSDDEPETPRFGGWWLPPSGWDDPLSPGFAVAEVMPLVVDVTAANAASILRAVARLVERAHPGFAPATADGVKEQLSVALEPAAAP